MNDTQPQTVAAFIAQHGLTMTAKPAADNPHADGEWAKGASHWLCTIARDGRTLEVPFSQGAAHRQWSPKKLAAYHGTYRRDEIAKLTAAPPTLGGRNPLTGGPEVIALRELRESCSEPTPPTLESVLDCLASDAASYDNARDFEDWAAEFGMDTDSRKAEKSYRVTGDQSKRLRHLLGDEAYRDLLFSTDQL